MADAVKRACVSCGEVKPHDHTFFRTVREQRNGEPYVYVKRKCRACEYEDRVEYGRRNREKQNARRRSVTTPAEYRARNLKKNYGLSLEEYDAILTAQGGACAICGTQRNENHHTGRLMPLTVDHCHKTGKVRGLLCGACNRGLGDFRDNPDNLRKAIDYLGAKNG